MRGFFITTKTKDMKRKTLLFSLLMLLSGGSVLADSQQTVTINGAPVDKFVSKLTFSGDQVTLIFDDNSSQTEDLSLVSIGLTYGTSGISDIQDEAAKVQDGRIYSISGQYVGTSKDNLKKGIYIVNGKKFIVK